MSSDKLDRDFDHDGTTYTGKLRKQEGRDGGWMFMAFKDNAPFGPGIPDIDQPTADEAMDRGIETFIAAMKG